MIQSYIVPVWTCNLLSDKVPQFFKTVTDGLNEWAAQSITIPYGYYIRDILRFYYGFNDDVILVFLKLVLAWILRNANDDRVVAEVNELLGMIMGSDRATGWTSEIKSLENELSMFFADMTGIDKPVIFHNENIDFTSSVRMTTTWTLDDAYTIMSQLNLLKFVYVIDFGYDGNINKTPTSVVYNKDTMFPDTGYLSMFLGTNRIEF